MSASGHKPTSRRHSCGVSFAPQSRHHRLASICPFSANTCREQMQQHWRGNRLLDHLVGALLEKPRHIKPDRLGGPEIDH
jgi:hypothetical protein